MIHVSKEILESETLNAIKRLDGEIRDYVNRKTVPGMALFRSGVYLVPVATMEIIDAWLEKTREQRERLVDRFMGEYTISINAARSRLGSLYDENDYPSMHKVRAAFGMETKYIGFSTPDNLKTISSALYRREEAKMAAAVSSATERIVDTLRGEAADLVGEIVERLSSKPGEKPKVFRDSLIGNIRDWLDNLPGRNSITGDIGLGGLAAKIESLLDGVDPQALRDDDRMRAEVAAGFSEIETKLSNMIAVRPTRKVNIDNLDS